MCLNCWKEYGSHTIKSDKVIELVNAIERVYNYSLSGGGLHIVIDDWNIEDCHILHCINDSIPQIEYAEEKLVTEKCAQLLLNCTLAERNSALYFQEVGY